MRQLPITGALAHSIKSTLNNIGFAFHVSWPWMLIILPFDLVGNAYAMLHQAPGKMDPGVAVITIAVSLLTMIAFSSIAVSWHRYILMDEIPQGLQRLRLDATVWRYFGNTLLIILILVAAAIPLGIVVVLLGIMLGEKSAILIIPAYAAAMLAAVSYSYRLGIKLPAIAIGRPAYAFKSALADSVGNFWRFVGLGILVGLISIGFALVVAVPAYFVGQLQNAALLYVIIAVQLLLNWLATVWTVTMLTSLYGYFAEGRNF